MSGKMLTEWFACLFVLANGVVVASAGFAAAVPGEAALALLQQHAEMQETAQVALPQLANVMERAAQVFKKGPKHTEEKLPASTETDDKPKTSALPELDGLMEHSTDVYKNIDERLGDLQSRLTRAQEEQRQHAAHKKEKLEKKLRVQKEETEAIKVVNKRLVGEIEELKAKNAELRGQANQISAETKSMRDQIEVVQDNISSAQEFMDTALKAFSQHFDHSKKLEVLRELDVADDAKARELAHEKRLAAVSGSRNYSMLELSAHTHPVAAAHSTLESLMSSLDDLASEQNSSIVLYEQEFNKTFQKEKLVQEDLLEEQAHLNATKADETELNARLHVAVDHVTKLHDLVKDQLFASVHFMQRVSGDMANKLKASIAAKSAQASAFTEIGVDVNRSRPGWGAWLLR